MIFYVWIPVYWSSLSVLCFVILIAQKTKPYIEVTNDIIFYTNKIC